MAKQGESNSLENAAPKPGASLAAVEGTLDRFFETAGVDKVFGKPIEKGEAIVIPAAEVISGIGFGMGHGYAVGSDEEGGSSGTGGGEGGGGGGRTFSRPVAVVIGTPEGIRVEPIVDPTKILLAAITAGGFMAAMFMRIVSPRRALKELKGDSFD